MNACVFAKVILVNDEILLWDDPLEPDTLTVEANSLSYLSGDKSITISVLTEFAIKHCS